MHMRGRIDAAEASVWSGRTALVTGIGGFVGSGLARGLLARGANVVGIVRDSPGMRLLAALDLAEQVDIVRGSITDEGLVERTIGEYTADAVFHLAAQSQVGVANANPVSTFETNIAGTWTVLEACRRSPSVQRVVVASSDKAYGDSPLLPYTEETPLNGSYPYDASKACTDILTRSYAVSFGVPAAIVRCANIYGPGDTNWARLVPGTIRSVLAGEDPIVRSDGTPERDYLFIDDAVHGYLCVADALPQVAGEAFNIGTDSPVSAIDLVQRIADRAGAFEVSPRILGAATNEIDCQWLASGKARDVVGWTASTSLDEGLDACLAWYRRHLDEPVRVAERLR
jgi:CDP-glucose 4,6-dehydratase